MKRILLSLFLIMFSVSYAFGAATVYPKHKWDLNDEFTTSLSAGSVNGTLSDGTQAKRTVVDTQGNLLSITGGNLSFAGGKTSPVQGDPGIWWPSITRTAGMLNIVDFTITDITKTIQLGYDSNTSGAIGSDGFQINNTINPIYSGTVGPAIFTPVNSTNYKLITNLRATGDFYFLKGGTLSNFVLEYIGQSGTTTPLYPSISNYNGAVASSYDRQPSQRWLPTPLLSHGFQSGITPSDGAGHAETSGLGSGGAGVTMTGTTWSMSGGKAVNTPNLGSELVADPGFNGTCGGQWDCGTGWSISGGVASATAGAPSYIEDTYRENNSAFPIGTWYRYLIDYNVSAGNVYSSVDGARNHFGIGSGSVNWTDRTMFGPANVIGIYKNATGAGTSFDNISVKSLTLSELFLTTPLSTSNVVASADLTVTAGTQAGLGLRLDSASTPTKGLVAYTDGTVCKLDQFTTATTWTNLITAACTYSAGAKMVAITDGVNARLYYNNALIGTTASVDASITGTIHGLFSTSPLNSLDNLVIYPRGNEGQYSYLDQFITP